MMSTPDSRVARTLGTWSVAAAAAELASLRRLVAERAALALVAALVAGIVGSSDPRLAVAFGVGAMIEGVLAFLALVRRRHVLLALAAERDTYALAEVRRFGASHTTRKSRLAFAHSIAVILRDSSGSGSVFLLDRVAMEAPTLATIAHALADEATIVEPAAMAALVQLLTDGDGSPLLNPTVQPDELGRTVARILTGIHPRRAAPAESLAAAAESNEREL